MAQKVADGTGRDHVAVDLQTAALERQTADTFQTLNALRLATARVRRGVVELEVPVEQVSLGDVVVLRAGKRVSIDGVSVEGHSHVDESLITDNPGSARAVANSALLTAVPKFVQLVRPVVGKRGAEVELGEKAALIDRKSSPGGGCWV